MSIAHNVEHVKATLKNHHDVTLIAASKYVDASKIETLVQLGVKDIGENRVDALLQKQNALAGLPIQWHFIGSLQSKKVKSMINTIDFLHSLDRLSLAEEIEKHRHHVLQCFVEVNISQETTKHGLHVDEVEAFIEALSGYKKIKIVGLMTLAEETDDVSVLEASFTHLRNIKERIEQKNLSHAPCHYLSMGMSNDYLIALRCGATHIRLGSILFKEAS